MGYAERLNTARAAKNGTELPPPAGTHHPWCQCETQADAAAPCTCERMPALRCEGADCGRVFQPAPYERPDHYARRVRRHAMLHRTPPGFTVGRIERTPRPEGTEP